MSEAQSPLPRPCDRFPGFFVGGAATVGFALVPQLLTLGECKFYFHASILEIHAGGDEREALLLSFADELFDLFFMHQQFAGAERGMVVNVAMLVGSDMAVEQPQFAVFDQPVGVFEIDQARPDGLNLGTC